MVDYSLTAIPVLGGFQQDKSARISEVTGKALVSIAIPHGGGDELQQAVMSAWHIGLPDIGHSSVSEQGTIRLLGLQQDQLFALLDYDGDQAVQEVAAKLGSCAYFTDQSDGWVMIHLAGSLSRAALERICPLNLHPDVFAVGDVARTAMEHMGVVILREDEEGYLLMGMRSFAGSLLHAVEVSVGNVLV